MKVCGFCIIIHTLTKSTLFVIVDTSESIECVAQFCTNYSEEYSEIWMNDFKQQQFI